MLRNACDDQCDDTDQDSYESNYKRDEYDRDEGDKATIVCRAYIHKDEQGDGEAGAQAGVRFKVN